jgi:predicted metal-dependent hydrolase
MPTQRIDPVASLQSDLFGHVAPPSAPLGIPERLTFTDRGRTLDALLERRSRVRRTSIRVDPISKSVVVVAPPLEPRASIERFVRDRLGWALAALDGLAASRAADTVELVHAGEMLAIMYEPSERARRVSLRVDSRTGHVKLVVPPRMSRERAVAFARQHAAWVAARLKRRNSPVPFADGAVIPVFDVPHRIRHQADSRGTVWVEGDEIHVAGGGGHVSRRVGDWLQAELRAHVMPLVRDKADRVGRPVIRVTLRDTATQWGSCARSGTLCFSLRLVFAPREVVDYVVAHEIAHLVHHNHSARFWMLAEKLTTGDMAACKTWLRRHGQSLMRYG